jgi:hypothetical protein
MTKIGTHSDRNVSLESYHGNRDGGQEQVKNLAQLGLTHKQSSAKSLLED